MKNKHSNRNISRVTGRRLALTFVLCALTAAPLFSTARVAQTSVQITNSSSVEIRHLYFSPVNTDDWGPDQMNQTVLGNGDSITLENQACTEGQIKVIAEDQNGCFISTTINCGESSTWAITDTTERSCGN